VKVATMAMLTAVITAAPAGLAHADQCQWLDDPAIATRAARELERQPDVVAFCEPCGDLAPGAPSPARTVMIQPQRDHAVSLTVNGDSVDLAYLYVKTSEHQYRNLAALAGCPTRGVSPSLRVDAATADGVLIHADRSLIAESATTAPPAPPPPTVVVLATPASMVIGIVGSSATLALLAAFAWWCASRRRFRHIPRASGLRPPT